MRVEPEWRARQKLDGGYELNLGEMELDLRRNNRDPQQGGEVVRFSIVSTPTTTNTSIERKRNATDLGRATYEAMDSDGDGKV